MSRTISAILKKIGLVLLALTILAAVVLLAIGGMMGGQAECAWDGTAQAFVDTNGNRVADPGEPPLAGVAFRVDDPYNHLTEVTGRNAIISDKAGKARLSVDLPGCPHAEFEVYAQPPGGFALTTAARLHSSDAASGGTFPFGFASQK